LIHFIVLPTDEIMIFYRFICGEGKKHELLEIQIGIIYPQKTGC